MSEVNNNIESLSSQWQENIAKKNLSAEAWLSVMAARCENTNIQERFEEKKDVFKYEEGCKNILSNEENHTKCVDIFNQCLIQKDTQLG